jgi:hypothetical protein
MSNITLELIGRAQLNSHTSRQMKAALFTLRTNDLFDVAVAETSYISP